MSKHILLVLTRAVEGKEGEFNEWYSDTHLRDVLGVDGFVAAQRFELARDQMGEPGPYPYLAIYEIESEDVSKALTALAGASSSMVLSDAMDMQNIAYWAYSPITERVT